MPEALAELDIRITMARDSGDKEKLAEATRQRAHWMGRCNYYSDIVGNWQQLHALDREAAELRRKFAALREQFSTSRRLAATGRERPVEGLDPAALGRLPVTAPDPMVAVWNQQILAERRQAWAEHRGLGAERLRLAALGRDVEARRQELAAVQHDIAVRQQDIARMEQALAVLQKAQQGGVLSSDEADLLADDPRPSSTPAAIPDARRTS
ncbi:hypothetical protein PY257_04495 [Ramlibacter sp. H39-3-26]|uniref:hypothetical protein n=1 Tax=Curvibacter soli TaxID=3031331 RepID=UPI0023DB8D52|nr:hypothetical protein [Ramlibacter sp. H39-3-26]MDF1484444.1 hypothetical protein [Ramlibacter sp. H39-3-26]